jgi:hypothetical protein
LIVDFNYSLWIKGSIPMKLICAECHCAPQECAKQSNLQCKTVRGMIVVALAFINGQCIFLQYMDI